MPYRIFFGVFALSVVILGALWVTFPFVDKTMWSMQSEYVQKGDAREFDFTRAYGHPGGPVVEGTIALHQIFSFSYLDALTTFLALFSGLIIGAASVLCYYLRPKTLWWLITAVVLTLHRLLIFTTPPTFLAALLLVLLLLMTVYLVEHRSKKNTPLLIAWAIVAGCAVATRIDMGVITVATFFLVLLFSYGWKKAAALFGGAVISFVVFDPFMWFMPFRHIADLFSKVVYHYAEFTPTHLMFSFVVSISGFLVVGMILSGGFLLLRKKIKLPFPQSFLIGMLVMTVCTYIILLTAHYQVIRYFVPIILMWEVLLPALIYPLLPEIEFSFLPEPENKALVQKSLAVALPSFLILVWVLIFLYTYMGAF